MISIAVFFGARTLWDVYNGEENIEELTETAALQGFVFITEDGP